MYICTFKLSYVSKSKQAIPCIVTIFFFSSVKGSSYRYRYLKKSSSSNNSYKYFYVLKSSIKVMSTNCTESVNSRQQPDWIIPKPEKELAQLKVFNSMTISLVH